MKTKVKVTLICPKCKSTIYSSLWNLDELLALHPIKQTLASRYKHSRCRACGWIFSGRDGDPIVLLAF